MEYMSQEKKPFIIYKRPKAVQMMYVDPKQFDTTIEHKVRFVQGANVFISFMLSYESFKVAYYFFTLQEACKDFAYMMIGFFICNLIWVITSIITFNSINSTRIKPVKYAYFTLGFIFITRITLYVVLGVLMKPFFQSHSRIDFKLIMQQWLYFDILVGTLYYLGCR